ncbi:MAG TPA: serine/threonine-protein kinase [Vicinamibacteria bacterium]|nr:serine/threonine-protein kinase [Vicinamibacteria bacterium]
MAIPERIGRFRVLDVLGRGAMGIVYRGLDESLDRQVALKVMAGQVEADARARFKREAQAAARLQHPNIITVYELGEHEGAPFMALELLEGVDLQRAIEAGLRPDPRVTLPIVLQLLAGLGHAHERGIVHRDVKPSNLFLPRGRPAKIMDFGVARLAAGTTAGGGLTSTGMVVGTPNYMSPEQVRAAELDGRSDLFSAGLILYELVTGEKAFRGDTIVALLFKIVHEDADLSLIPRGERWNTLRRVVERALQRDPGRRYADALSMSDDLAGAWHELGGAGDWTSAADLGLLSRSQPRAVELGTTSPPLAPPVSLGTAPTEAAPLEPAPAPPPPAAPSAAPLRLALALGVAALVILAGTAVLLLRRPAAPAPSAAPQATVAAAPVTLAPPLPVTPATAAPQTTPAPKPSTTTPAPPPTTAAAAEAHEPAPVNARVDRADNLLAAGRYAAALAEARAVLKREPGNEDAQQIAEEAEAALLIEACLKNARAALARGDKDAAVEELKRGLAVNKNEARLMSLWREATQ